MSLPSPAVTPIPIPPPSTYVEDDFVVYRVDGTKAPRVMRVASVVRGWVLRQNEDMEFNYNYRVVYKDDFRLGHHGYWAKEHELTPLTAGDVPAILAQ